jgi:hypothetical protein
MRPLDGATLQSRESKFVEQLFERRIQEIFIKGRHQFTIHMLDFLKGKKTYIIAIAAIAYAVLGVISGNMDSQAAIQVILAALGAMGIRNGITSEIQALGQRRFPQ